MTIETFKKHLDRLKLIAEGNGLETLPTGETFFKGTRIKPLPNTNPVKDAQKQIEEIAKGNLDPERQAYFNEIFQESKKSKKSE